MEQRYVGIDFHRHRSVLVHKDGAGTLLETVHLDNDAEAFAREIAKAGEHPEVVLEAGYGWYWLADLLDELGANLEGCKHTKQGLTREAVNVPPWTDGLFRDLPARWKAALFCQSLRWSA